jgi:hypothetical protein
VCLSNNAEIESDTIVKAACLKEKEIRMTLGQGIGDVRVAPCIGLVGCKDALSFQADPHEIYVAPEIFSLLQTDFERTISSLLIRVLPGSGKLLLTEGRPYAELGIGN